MSDRSPQPDPAHGVFYVYGGRLPARYRDWVRFGLTSRHWLLRHVLRVLTRILPFAVAAIVVLLLFTPVPAWAIGGVVVLGLLSSLWYAVGLARDFCTSRLRRHEFGGDVNPPKSAWILSDG